MAAAVGLGIGLWAGAQWLGGAGAPAPVAAGALPGPGVIAGQAEVWDGDTLRIGSTRIRIQGIDAPELGDLCQRSDGSGWDCGAWSAQLARERFGGRWIECQDLGERSYDRVVARCSDGAEDFAEVMLRAGAAWACERYALRHPHSQGYMALEAAAAARGKGIFAGPRPPRAGFCQPVDGRSAAAPAEDVTAAATTAAVGDCTIKGNINRAGERIYHMPGQAHYDAVVIRPEFGQRWFCSEAEAQAAGWRRSRR